MTTTRSILSLAVVLLFTRLQLFQSTADALPVAATGSGMPDDQLDPTTVDCSLASAVMTTELEPVKAGLLALRDYTTDKYDSIRVRDKLQYILHVHTCTFNMHATPCCGVVQ